jgi:hypothetical protein
VHARQWIIATPEPRRNAALIEILHAASDQKKARKSEREQLKHISRPRGRGTHRQREIGEDRKAALLDIRREQHQRAVVQVSRYEVFDEKRHPSHVDATQLRTRLAWWARVHQMGNDKRHHGRERSQTITNSEIENDASINKMRDGTHAERAYLQRTGRCGRKSSKNRTAGQGAPRDIKIQAKTLTKAAIGVAIISRARR